VLGHRKLDTDDYVAILKRRAWVIAIPLILLPIAAYVTTFFLAPKYLSQTLVIIDEQRVPDEYVRPVISESLDSRLSSMKEQILSRSRIQPIIERYNLYGNTPMNLDDKIQTARNAIAIKPIHSDIPGASGLPGFSISFTASDPRTAQLICGEITSLFIAENAKSRESATIGTTDFLKGQLADAKRSLDDQDAKLADFQRQYIGKLPGEESPNVNMLTSLNTQLEAATQALSRLQDDKSFQEAKLAQLVQNASTGNGQSVAVQATEFQKEQLELQNLQTEEADMSSHYTADHPDLIDLRRRIADLQRRIANPLAHNTAPIKPTTSSTQIDSPEIQQIRAQLHGEDIGIREKTQEQQQIQNAVRVYQDRISSSPLVEAQYKQLTRDYDTTRKSYDDLLAKMNESKMAADLERRQEGEQFRILDAPNLPDSPSFPNRKVFLGGGIFLGLTLGLGIAALIEWKDTSLRSERDIWAIAKLPTLAVISFANDGGPQDNAGRLKLLAGIKPDKKALAGARD
jgi:polysaccharide chain length determinant protein (PEP-CTERM system associated)